MFTLKKTTKFDGKIKGVHVFDGQLIDDEGEVVDIMKVFENAYGEMPFDLSTTTKQEEELEVDQTNEIDASELA